eukprot:6184308-Pleurochrysis_carterae.AAC.3
MHEAAQVHPSTFVVLLTMSTRRSQCKTNVRSTLPAMASLPNGRHPMAGLLWQVSAVKCGCGGKRERRRACANGWPAAN